MSRRRCADRCLLSLRRRGGGGGGALWLDVEHVEGLRGRLLALVVWQRVEETIAQRRQRDLQQNIQQTNMLKVLRSSIFTKGIERASITVILK